MQIVPIYQLAKGDKCPDLPGRLFSEISADINLDLKNQGLTRSVSAVRAAGGVGV